MYFRVPAIIFVFIFINSFLFAETTSHKLVVKSNQPPKALNLFVKKGEVVSFKVKGSWSMMHPQWRKVDYRGHTNFRRINKHYLGTLVASIGGGKTFAVYDGFRFKSNESGRLMLYPNRGNYKHLNTSGSLSVEISGVIKVTALQALSLKGWDAEKLNTAKKAAYLSSEEKDVILYLNMIRTNPPKFANQYLKHLRHKGGYYRECYDQMLKTKKRGLLYPSKALSFAARDHAQEMGRKGKKGHISPDGRTPWDRIKKYDKSFRGGAENISYGKRIALQINLQLLIDHNVPSRGHRKNILNPKWKFVGVAIRRHKRYKFNCVQNFGI